MHDDQRPDRRQSDESAEERFDEALDELFGPVGDEQEVRPRPTVQKPQPPGGPTPPARTYRPDPAHHRVDDEHVLGPENEPPPPSYAADESGSGAATRQEIQGSVPIAPEREVGPAGSRRVTRDWRKIACFGCLIIVAIPALCLGALIVLGLIVGEETAEPTAIGRFVDDATFAPTPPDSQAQAEVSRDGVLAEPFESIREGRAPARVQIDGEDGYGAFERPVPVGYPGPLGDGWDLRIDEVVENANRLVADANMFNEPPAAGRQFVIVRITITNNTAGTGVFDASFRLRLAGALTGTTYTTFEDVDRCGVIADPFGDDEIAPGAEATGNVCWQVLIEDLPGLVLYNESFSEADAEIWFRLAGSAPLAVDAP